ncbi:MULTISPECIES: DUF1127 domain-containing protein [unclassified Agarivorans]|uniref:DUF1127 domain-containing protein n=1 Tax=unclassified Agarivorans TaxID=2636026 RepID=UPI003D7EAE9D
MNRHSGTHQQMSQFRVKPDLLLIQRLWFSIKYFAAHYEQCIERAKLRRQLASLPDYLLRDIGVSRRQANIEASKSFWKK